MAEVDCSRCGKPGEKLPEPPLPGPWGVAVLEETCATCWAEWREEQTRLINHERLQPAIPEDRQRLYAHLREYLNLQRAPAPKGQG